ncbi:tripartite motif-containing protein 2-like [Saccostrea cucullata]|uniref:tripartite motif-containing protein 2-like n=1 Tax=Saccostrea cuccullata TaxID=36930 RepID=UPI002ED15F21
MYSEVGKQYKVVRYSNFTENQTIQFDKKGKPLYSESSFTKHISENRNLDICVADYSASAVVVVNKAGNLRFRYTGHSSIIKKKLFKPWGITTDSQCHILSADFYNNCIRILDQNGQFLRYIDNCELNEPTVLCVDKSDNLFVAEDGSGNLKEIRYVR